MKRKSGKGARAAAQVCQRLEHRLLLSGVSFLQFGEVETGSHPLSAAAADFNADGKTDIAEVNYQGNTIGVRLNQGGGTLGGMAVYATGLGPFSIVASDLNGDGKIDLAVANYYGGSASVLLNRGDGTFAASNEYGAGVRPHGIAVADFDADGSPDLVLANESSNSVSVLRNRGDGSFAAKVDYGVGSAPRSTSAGDFNGDGRPDIAVANSASNTLSVLLNQGDGTFAKAVDYPSGGIGPHSITSGDLNGDGRTDLAVANYAGSTVGVLLNQGVNGFAAARTYPVGTGPFGLTVADLNGDSQLDLAVASDLSNTVGVLLNNGGGIFGSPVAIASAASPSFVAVGDFNGDSRPDMAVANADSDTLRVFLNTTRTIVSGQPVTDQILSLGSDNVYAFTAVRGGTLHITMEEADGSDFDPELHLFTNTGHDFDYRFGTHSTYVDGTGDNLPYTGTYYVVAGDYGNNQVGTYTLRLTTTTGSPMPVPTAPGLTASPGSTVASLTSDLAWTGSAGATEYGLYVSKLQPNGTYALVFDSRARGITIDGSASSYSLPPGVLTDGGRYRWNMNARINGAWGPYTTRLYFRVNTGTTAVPPAPPGLTVVVSERPAAQLTWAAVSGAVGYQVYRATSTAGPWTSPVDVVARPSADDPDLVPGTTYYYRVAAYNAAGSSPLSPAVVAQTPTVARTPAPTGLVSTITPGGHISLTWSSVAGAARYTVWRQAGVGAPFVPYHVVDAPAATDTDAAVDFTLHSTYGYRVTASSTGRLESAASNTTTATFRPTTEVYDPGATAATDYLRPAYDPISTVYYRNLTKDGIEWEVADLSLVDWSRRTIILTHGWNDGFDPARPDGFIDRFAQGAPDDVNVLAVDWYHGGSPLGSNPNNLTTGEDVAQALAERDPLIPGVDAFVSSLNGVLAGHYLAVRLNAAHADPAKLMLVGHSNGAGYMASVAETLDAYTNVQVQELAALDAPVETVAYWQVRAAASSVYRIENYYMPLVQSDTNTLGSAATGEHLTLSTGAGAPVFGATNVTNFELSYGISQQVLGDNASGVGHSLVPSRYALTARNDTESPGRRWGFQTSHFVTGQDPIQLGGVWAEKTVTPGYFLRMQTPTDLTRYLLNQFESISAKAVKRVGSEIATLTTNLIKGTGAKLVAIVDDVSGAIKRFIHVGGGGGGGGSFSQPVSAAPAGGSNNDLRAVADVTVPVGAAFLTFDLSVLDAGNSDVLEIALGDDLVGEIDLRTQQAAADTAVQLYVGRYAGRATTLTFLTPSDVPTTAEYTIGNINFNVLDPDTTAPHGRVFGTDDGKGMASGDSLMIAFDEPVHVLDPSGLSLSRDGGPNLLTSAQTLSSDDQKVWILRGLGGLALADGNYVFRINAAAVRDLSDNPIDGDADGVAGGDLTLSFFRLAGDANRDRTVNFADLLALARNYNKTGATWADGDFDGNGIVNFNDLLTLARNYNKTLPAAGAAPAPAAAMDLGALAAAMGIAVPTTSPTKPTPPPAAAKKPPVSPKPAPKPTPVVRAVTPAPVAAKSPAASVLRDDDKAKPVFSTTRVVKPAPAKPKVVARAKGR